MRNEGTVISVMMMRTVPSAERQLNNSPQSDRAPIRVRLFHHHSALAALMRVKVQSIPGFPPADTATQARALQLAHILQSSAI